MRVDLSVSADLTTLTNYLASSFGYSERFIKDYEDVPSAYRGKEFYGTTGSDYVKGTGKVERFHGDQGNDTYIGGGSPGVVINSVSSRE